jgi:hypothetical protein
MPWDRNRALAGARDRRDRHWHGSCKTLHRERTKMSQANVERIVGRLVTDEDFRRAFREEPERVVHGLAERGCELTRAEIETLVSLDPLTLERFADSLDPRLQKASLRGPAASTGSAGRLL